MMSLYSFLNKRHMFSLPSPPRTAAPAGSIGQIVKGDVAINSEQETHLLDYSVKSFSMNVMEAASKNRTSRKRA